MKNLPGVTEDFIGRHEEVAGLSPVLMATLGLACLAGLIIIVVPLPSQSGFVALCSSYCFARQPLWASPQTSEGRSGTRRLERASLFRLRRSINKKQRIAFFSRFGNIREALR